MSKPSKEQKKLMKNWQEHTGFEFMHMDEVRADDADGFLEFWDENVQWLRDVATETDTIANDYRRVALEGGKT